MGARALSPRAVGWRKRAIKSVPGSYEEGAWLAKPVGAMRERVPPLATGLRARRLLPRAAVGFCVAAALVLLTGCKRRKANANEPGGELTQMQANRRIRQAIRQSSEGVILLPSKKADAVYELPRLTEIAHELRQPAAACFLERALETMEFDAPSESGFSGVPDGQAKLRVRISPGGLVQRAEVLESGFSDSAVPDCVGRAVKQKRFPQNKTGTNQYIDLVFWVSLGQQRDAGSPQQLLRVRREQTEAAVRARQCLEGRMPAGEYVVEGLNFVGRDGRTMANRVEQDAFPDEVRRCVVAAFREIRLPADAQTFLRPVHPSVRFVVHEPTPGARTSHVEVQDEEWLRLLKLEERAQRAKQRAELMDREDAPDTRPPGPLVDEGEPPLPEDALPDDPAPTGEPGASDPPKPRQDPGKGGIKLQLGPRT